MSDFVPPETPTNPNVAPQQQTNISIKPVKGWFNDINKRYDNWSIVMLILILVVNIIIISMSLWTDFKDKDARKKGQNRQTSDGSLISITIILFITLILIFFGNEYTHQVGIKSDSASGILRFVLLITAILSFISALLRSIKLKHFENKKNESTNKYIMYINWSMVGIFLGYMFGMSDCGRKD